MSVGLCASNDTEHLSPANDLQSCCNRNVTSCDPFQRARKQHLVCESVLKEEMTTNSSHHGIDSSAFPLITQFTVPRVTPPPPQQKKTTQELIYTTHLPKDIANNRRFSRILPQGCGV